MTEFSLRANRDTNLGYLVERQTLWHGWLKGLIEEGIAANEWPQDFDAAGTASLIITVMTGVRSVVKTSPQQVDGGLQQLRRLLALG